MILSGYYNVYKNDQLISRSPNLITDSGKEIIAQYLSGTTDNWATHIAVGAISTTASTSDYKLYYEILRLPILARTAYAGTSSSLSSSATINTTSVTVSTSSSISVGNSVSGTGISSSATVLVTGIFGNVITVSHPVTSTFSGSFLNFTTPRKIKFRSRLSQDTKFDIYEIGIFNSANPTNGTAFDGKIMTNFDETYTIGGWTSGSVTTATSPYSPRLGTSTLKISPTPAASVVAILGDTSSSVVNIGASNSYYGQLSISTTGFENNYDTAKLLLYSTASGASITITGQDNTTGTTTNTINILGPVEVASGGPYVLESTISKGSTYNDYLSKIQIVARTSSSSPTLYLDSLKFSNTTNYNYYYGMISRSVLSSPIQKDAEEELEIEYELFLFP